MSFSLWPGFDRFERAQNMPTVQDLLRVDLRGLEAVQVRPISVQFCTEVLTNFHFESCPNFSKKVHIQQGLQQNFEVKTVLFVLKSICGAYSSKFAAIILRYIVIQMHNNIIPSFKNDSCPNFSKQAQNDPVLAICMCVQVWLWLF